MRLLTLVFLLGVGSLFAQKAPDLSKYSTSKKKLQALANYCDELIATEQYELLRTTGKKGLSMTPKKDFWNQSLFNFYVGMTFNYGLETDSAAFYMERSEQFGRKAKDKDRTLEALKQLHYVYSSYGSRKKKERIISEFEHVIDTTKNEKVKSEMYSIMGDYYVNLGQYERGLKKMISSAKIQRKLLSKGNATDSTNFGVQLIVISELYVALKKYDFALNYLREGEGFVTDYVEASAHIYKDYVECYCAKNDLKKAKGAYFKLKKLLDSESAAVSSGMLVESDVILAQYYNDRNDFKNALLFAEDAQRLAPKYADEFLKAQIKFTLGLIYLKQKDYNKALSFLKAAEPTTNEDDPELKARLVKALAEAYGGLGKWKEAFSYQKTYVSLNEKLSDEKAKKNVAEMEALYQNEKKQSEINELSSKDAINTLKIDEANKQKIYLSIGIFAVLVIGILFFVQSRIRKRLNAQLQTLNQELKEVNANKTRFFSIINHDLRSPVANLIHFLQLQKDSPDLIDASTKERLEQKTMEGAENLLRSMEDMLLWCKGQMQQFKPSIEQLEVGNVFSELRAHFASDQHIALEADTQSSIVVKTDYNYLLTILRNLTANAIKALEKTENPKIQWLAAEHNGKIVLTILDNGPGATSIQFKALYDSTEVVGIKSGLGLHLIRDLAQAINCKVEVETNEGSGTKISLIFK